MDYSELNSVLDSSNGEAEAIFAVFGFVIVVVLIALLLGLAFKIISRWVFFKKCGKEGWRALIPFYTDYTLVEIAGLNWWWVLIILAGTVLSTMQSTINSFNNISDTPSVGVFAVLLSFVSVFASFAALFGRINQSVNIAKKFNKNGGYAVLLVLFEPIMLLVLGLTKDSKYDETVEVSPNGLIGMKSNNQSMYCPDCGTQVQADFCSNCGKKVR